MSSETNETRSKRPGRGRRATSAAKADDGLTPRQERFVQEYLTGLNATAAYKRAGYQAKNDNVAGVMGHRLLRNAKVQAAIRQAREDMQQRAEVSRDWVIRALKETIDLALRDVPVLDRKGEPTGYYTHRAHEAIRPLDLLGRMLGMFPDRK